MKRPTRVAFVALGCAKNLVDSERMLGQLAESGAELTNDPAGADVIVVNTCGFLEASRTEAHQEIAAAVAQKRKGRCRRVVVAGCLVQRDGQRLLEDVPGIDALVGVHQRDDVARVALDLPTGSGKNPRKHRPAEVHLGEYHAYVATDTDRLRLTPRHYAYLRVSEGCNQKCTFCTIPSIRGPMHCKPPQVILAEARELIADGVAELNLIGQDTTSYGHDIGYEAGLAGLLRALNRLDGVRWLRLLYAYPSVFTDAMIEAMAECEKVVKYIDIPLQHISDRVLKGMARRVTRQETERLLERIRAAMPGVSIRTTFISGFPGETPEESRELLEFVRDQRFSAVGVFPYSTEPDTPAGRMTGQVPLQVRHERANRIMEVQQEVAFQAAAAQASRFFEVLIDAPHSPGRWSGRHGGQAPEVDASTLVEGRDLAPGQFVRVLCTGSEGYDLIARPTEAILPVL